MPSTQRSVLFLFNLKDLFFFSIPVSCLGYCFFISAKDKNVDGEMMIIIHALKFYYTDFGLHVGKDFLFHVFHAFPAKWFCVSNTSLLLKLLISFIIYLCKIVSFPYFLQLAVYSINILIHILILCFCPCSIFFEQMVEKIEKFHQVFSLPLGLTKLLQAFWLLDHRDYEVKSFFFTVSFTIDK